MNTNTDPEVWRVALELHLLNRRCSRVMDRVDCEPNHFVASCALGDFHRLDRQRQALWTDLQQLTRDWTEDEKNELGRAVQLLASSL
jgi:hypothetical protein